MGDGNDDMKYVLLLKDYFSSYCWIVPFTAARNKVVATSISRWIQNFTLMTTWVSECGSKLKNKVLERISKTHGMTHHFTITYSPWANGKVERLCLEVLRVSRAVISEKRLGQQDWSQIIQLVQTAFNESLVKHLGARKDGTY